MNGTRWIVAAAGAALIALGGGAAYAQGTDFGTTLNGTPTPKGGKNPVGCKYESPHFEVDNNTNTPLRMNYFLWTDVTSQPGAFPPLVKAIKDNETRFGIPKIRKLEITVPAGRTTRYELPEGGWLIAVTHVSSSLVWQVTTSTAVCGDRNDREAYYGWHFALERDGRLAGMLKTR